MQYSSRRSLAIIIAVLLIGAIVVWFGLWRPSHAPDSRGRGSPGIPDVALARKADAAIMVSVDTVEAAAAASEQFYVGLEEALARLPEADRLDPARAAEFASLARERFAMFLRPDYEEYCRHHTRLAEERKTQRRANVPIITREQFTTAASIWEDMSLSPTDVEVIVRYRVGAHRAEDSLGRVGRFTDVKGWYSDAGEAPLPASLGADVYEAWFPVEFADVASGVMRRGFAGFALVWLPSEGRWLPWQTVLIDPAPTVYVAYPPWL